MPCNCAMALPSLVVDARVLHAEGALKGRDGAGVVPVVDAHHLDVVARVLLHEQRRLGAARGARGVPGVDEHHLAAVVGDVHGVARKGRARERQRLRGFLEDRDGAVAAHIAGRVRGRAGRAPTSHRAMAITTAAAMIQRAMGLN